MLKNKYQLIRTSYYLGVFDFYIKFIKNGKLLLIDMENRLPEAMGLGLGEMGEGGEKIETSI